jgi:hypothetical protein
MLASFYIVITSLSGHTRGTVIPIHAAIGINVPLRVRQDTDAEPFFR